MEGVSEPAVFRLPGGLPVLTDRRIAAGITFKHHANQTRDKFLIEIMGGSVAAFDEDALPPSTKTTRRGGLTLDFRPGLRVSIREY